MVCGIGRGSDRPDNGIRIYTMLVCEQFQYIAQAIFYTSVRDLW